MDPITHSLVGGLVAKTVKSSRRRFWILMFLGEFPDIDVFFSHLGTWAFWLQHRGFTHSFLGVGLQAVFFAWVFRRMDPGDFHRRVTVYSIPLFLHVFCDYLTSYGVPLLSPFDFREFAADLVPAVTLIPLLFMIIGLYLLHRRQSHGWKGTHGIWTAWVLYIIFSLSSRAAAWNVVGPEVVRPTLVSGLANPFRWTAVSESKPCCSYVATSIDVLLQERTPLVTVGTPLDDFPVQASLKAPKTKRYVDTTRWPVARVLFAPSGGWNVEWGKMIFSSRGVVRANMRVHVAHDGSILGEEQIYGFWSPDGKTIRA